MTKKKINQKLSNFDKHRDNLLLRKNKLFTIIFSALLVVVVVFVWHHHEPNGISARNSANSFYECAALGNPIVETNPRRCWTPDGRNFVEENMKNEPKSGLITISGEITCLPKTGKGPQTTECAIGLKGDNGSFYALKDLYKNDPEYKFSQVGLKVKVDGLFSSEKAKGPDGNQYDTIGTITVEAINPEVEF